jgi:hypothetical protein
MYNNVIGSLVGQSDSVAISILLDPLKNILAATGLP